MATMKTLSLVTSAGIKCFQTRLRLDSANKCTTIINAVPVRHARFKASPLVSNDTSKYTGFEVSRSPEEWKFVQALLPQPVIQEPSPKPEYPSGWRPQNPPANAPYFLKRSANHQLPVYLTRFGPRGMVRRTRVKHVQGDVWALDKELHAVLASVYPKETVQSQVNEVAGQITIRGDYVSAITEYLKSKGW